MCMPVGICEDARACVCVCLQLEIQGFPLEPSWVTFHFIHGDSIIQPASRIPRLCLQNAEISGWPPCPPGVSVSANGSELCFSDLSGSG